ncbi:MAG TPA: hypothetical protein PKL57_07745 [Candidatus Wallbacteria bacterium]|nr:hypothetical protein [Candidatus Wallbacteria bacterium]
MSKIKSGYKNLMLIFIIVVLCLNTFKFFKVNYRVVNKIKFNQSLLDIIKSSPERLLINDVLASDYISLIFPFQKHTAMAYIQTYSLFSKQNYPHYCRLKEKILNSPYARDYATAISTLDGAYKYGHSDYILLHNGRKNRIEVNYGTGEANIMLPLYLYNVDKGTICVEL